MLHCVGREAGLFDCSIVLVGSGLLTCFIVLVEKRDCSHVPLHW